MITGHGLVSAGRLLLAFPHLLCRREAGSLKESTVVENTNDSGKSNISSGKMKYNERFSHLGWQCDSTVQITLRA